MDNALIWLAIALLSVPAVLALASGLGGALSVAPFCCAGAAFWVYCARRGRRR
jgi:predicted ABC-type sugar transport system permease subunit